MTGQRIDSSAGPVPLSDLLDDALNRLKSINAKNESKDGIVFIGNRHESVPRALFTDHRLTPLERNAWQVIRILLIDGGVTTFPTYARLSPFLTSTPCSGKASDETVARALTMLRLTRWLTLIDRRRCPASGQIQGNLYVLNDEPLTPYEAIRLDQFYLELVSHALTHASKAIRRVGCHTLTELTQDPLLSMRLLPSRIHTIVERLDRLGWERSILASDSEVGPEGGSEDPLRIPKQDSTVRTDSINKEIRTVLNTKPAPPLRLPDRFRRLRPEQQAGALAALQPVEAELQQAVLDEWDARCRTTTIRNPAGYLFGITQKAIRGEFNSWASRTAPQRKESPPQLSAVLDVSLREAQREIAERNIAKLREMLQGR